MKNRLIVTPTGSNTGEAVAFWQGPWLNGVKPKPKPNVLSFTITVLAYFFILSISAYMTTKWWYGFLFTLVITFIIMLAAIKRFPKTPKPQELYHLKING